MLSILEFAAGVVTDNPPPELEKFKSMIYNNLCSYPIRYEQEVFINVELNSRIFGRRIKGIGWSFL